MAFVSATLPNCIKGLAISLKLKFAEIKDHSVHSYLLLLNSAMELDTHYYEQVDLLSLNDDDILSLFISLMSENPWFSPLKSLRFLHAG